jgi:aconitate hydratase
LAAFGQYGKEFWNIEGLGNDLQPGQTVTLVGKDLDGNTIRFAALLRIDTPVEVEYYRNGGILNSVLRQLLQK